MFSPRKISRSHGLFFAALLLIAGATFASAARPPEFTSIDFPGAVLTNAQGINPGGEIVGFYLDTAGKQHGFLLSGGNFTSIDYPGAIVTGARGINPGGTLWVPIPMHPVGRPTSTGFCSARVLFRRCNSPTQTTRAPSRSASVPTAIFMVASTTQT